MPQFQYRNPAYGQSVVNIAEALFGNPHARGQMALQEAQQAQAEAATGLSTARTRGLEQKYEALGGIGQAILGAYPGMTPEQGDYFGAMTQAGVFPKQTAKGGLWATSLFPNVTPEALSSAAVGAGALPRPDTAFTVGQGEAIREEEWANKMALLLAGEQAKAALGTAKPPKVPKTYKVTGKDLDDLLFFALQNSPGAIETKDDKSYVNPKVLASLPPELLEAATTAGANVLSQTNNMQAAVLTFRDVLNRGATFQPPVPSTWPFSDEPARFEPRETPPTASRTTLPDPLGIR